MKQNDLSTKLCIRKIKSFFLTKITPKIHLSIIFSPKSSPFCYVFRFSLFFIIKMKSECSLPLHLMQHSVVIHLYTSNEFPLCFSSRERCKVRTSYWCSGGRGSCRSFMGMSSAWKYLTESVG